MTVDETWVHYYEPENKAKSRQWVVPGSSRSKKFKTQPSAGHSILGGKRCYYVGLFTKEVQDATICWPQYFGRQKALLFWTFYQEEYNNWSVLCKLAGSAENRHP